MIEWVACDPASGQVIESLPGLRLESSLPSYVGRGDTIKVALPVTQRPARWMIATEPARVVLVAHYDDEDQTILWAGPVTYREYGSGPYITMTAQSVDGWLDTQYTGTAVAAPYSVIDRDQCLILADLLSPAAAQFHGRVDISLSGVPRSLTILDSEDKTCASAATTLMGMAGGPEYAIGWEWDSSGALVCVVTIAGRIGAETPAVLLTGLEWQRTDDYAPGKGATIVTAVATSDGAIRNQATRAATDLLAAGYLPIEHRYTPDTGITSTLLLGQHADGKLAAIRQGTSAISLSFHPDSPIRIGRDLRVGDMIEADLSNPDMPEATATLTARMLGFVADADRTSGEIIKITPILAGDS